MVKRILAVLAAFGLLVVAGCAAGPDGLEAKQILDQATAAEAQLESMTFTMNIQGDMAGQTFTMQMDGGGYLKGEREGDLVMRASMTAPDLPATSFQMVARDGRAYFNFNGMWQEIPGGLGQEQTAQLEQQLSGFDFSKYVTNVTVEDGTTFLGEPVTKIVGTIDTKGLFGGLFDQLGSAAGSLGGGFAPPEGALDGIGDIRAVLYVSDATHLVQAMHMEFSFEEQGQKGSFAINYALRSVNEPVEIPEPAVVA
jgi:hypothetical protein